MKLTDDFRGTLNLISGWRGVSAGCLVAALIGWNVWHESQHQLGKDDYFSALIAFLFFTNGAKDLMRRTTRSEEIRKAQVRELVAELIRDMSALLSKMGQAGIPPAQQMAVLDLFLRLMAERALDIDGFLPDDLDKALEDLKQSPQTDSREAGPSPED